MKIELEVILWKLLNIFQVRNNFYIFSSFFDIFPAHLWSPGMRHYVRPAPLPPLLVKTYFHS